MYTDVTLIIKSVLAARKYDCFIVYYSLINRFFKNVHTFALDLSTSDVSANADEDYESKYQVPVTVEPGKTRVVPIKIKDDNRFELDETFQVKLNGSAVGEGIQIMTILIEDDDG